jgi:hypothetical protein
MDVQLPIHTKLNFGKYKGWTLEEIYQIDYHYLIYCINTNKVCQGFKDVIIQFLNTKTT